MCRIPGGDRKTIGFSRNGVFKTTRRSLRKRCDATNEQEGGDDNEYLYCQCKGGELKRKGSNCDGQEVQKVKANIGEQGDYEDLKQHTGGKRGG